MSKPRKKEEISGLFHIKLQIRFNQENSIESMEFVQQCQLIHK